MGIRNILCCIVLISAVYAIEILSLNDFEEWRNFKIKFDKKYNTLEEESLRIRIFLENKKKIEQHNNEHDLGKVTFRTKVNKFSDLTVDEVKKTKKGLLPQRTSSSQSRSSLFLASTPKTVDWREAGAVTGVKEQGFCLSCWIFSAVGAVESQHFIKTGELVDLSVQNVADCYATPEEGEVCPVGWMNDAFQYIQEHGIDTEDSYPYLAKIGTCRFNESSVGATISGYTDLPSGDEVALRRAVGQLGPVSVAIDSSDGDFIHYSSGVFYSSDCKNTEDDLDHALLVVGYGKERATPYWLVKNSWGTSWGEEGYGKIARNEDNHCGIATMSSYPYID